MVIVVVLAAGCFGNTAIYVPDGTPVRLRQTVKNCRVWVLDENRRPMAAVMDLPEGWFCLPVDVPEQ